MSMNLNLEADGVNVELLQTPTEITYMILVDEDGLIGVKKGKEAKQALQAYLFWVFSVEGEGSNPYYHEEKNRILQIIKTAKELEVYCT